MRLDGAHVLLTGATGVLGSALAAALAAEGARMTLVTRGGRSLRLVADRVSGAAVPCDLQDEVARATLVDRAEALHGPVDVLINNAGVETAAHVAEEDPAQQVRTVTLNLIAPIALCRHVLPGMLQRGRGTIVNISSLSGVSVVPGMATYAATKAGLSHFTSGLREDLRGSGIRTLLVELGPIPSPMMDRARAHPATDAAFARLLRTRLLAMTGADDAARAVCAALASDARHVRRPRRALPYALLTQVPRDLASWVLVGTPRGATR